MAEYREEAGHREAWLDYGAAPLLALALAVWLLRGLWGGNAFLAGHDTVSHDFIMWEWGWRTLLGEGRVPLWCPFLFGGFPFVASFAFCPFYPPAWLSVALPTGLALSTQYALHLGLGALGFYFFCRSFGLGAGAALIALLLYGCGSHVGSLAYPGHLAKVQALAWLPWAAACAWRVGGGAGWRWAAGLGMAWALQLLASHAQVFYATAGLCTVMLLGRAMVRADWRGRGRAGRGLLLAGALCALLSAVQMLPALDLAGRSNRADGVAYEEASFGGLPPEELLEIFLPSMLGDSTGRAGWMGEAAGQLPYLGRWHASGPEREGAERLVSDYAGATACLLALWGLAWGLRHAPRRSLFLLGVLVLTLLVATGPATPLHRWAYEYLPGFSKFRSPGTWMLLAHFSLMALAALGLGGWLRWVGRLGARGRLLWAVALCVLGCNFLAIAYVLDASQRHALQTLLARAAKDPALAEGLPELLRHRLPLLAFARSLTWSAATMLCGGALLLGLWLWRARTAAPRLLAPAVGIALGLIIVADGGGQIRRFLPIAPLAPYRQYLEGPGPERFVAASARSDWPGLRVAGGELSNRSLLHRVRSRFGYHPVVAGSHERLIREIGAYDAPLLDRMYAVNWLALPLDAPAPEGFEPLAQGGGRNLYRRRDTLPLAWVPRRVRSIGTRWDALPEGIWGQRFADADPLATAWTESDATQDLSGALPELRVEILAPDRLRLALDLNPAKHGPIQVLSALPYDPGWRLRREDGRPLPDAAPSRANGHFLLLPLPPATPVLLEYRPPIYLLGRLLSTLTLVALLTAMALSWRRTKKRPRA